MNHAGPASLAVVSAGMLR